jgi:hypothetical protein
VIVDRKAARLLRAPRLDPHACLRDLADRQIHVDADHPALAPKLVAQVALDGADPAADAGSLVLRRVVVGLAASRR